MTNPTQNEELFPKASPSTSLWAAVDEFVEFIDFEPYVFYNDPTDNMCHMLIDDNTVYGIFRGMNLEWAVFYLQQAFSKYGQIKTKYDLWLM